MTRKHIVTLLAWALCLFAFVSAVAEGPPRAPRSSRRMRPRGVGAGVGAGGRLGAGPAGRHDGAAGGQHAGGVDGAFGWQHALERPEAACP